MFFYSSSCSSFLSRDVLQNYNLVPISGTLAFDVRVRAESHLFSVNEIVSRHHQTQSFSSILSQDGQGGGPCKVKVQYVMLKY